MSTDNNDDRNRAHDREVRKELTSSAKRVAPDASEPVPWWKKGWGDSGARPRGGGSYDPSRRSEVRREWWDDYDASEDTAWKSYREPKKRTSLSSFWGDRFSNWKSRKSWGADDDTFLKVSAVQSTQRVGSIIFGNAAHFSWGTPAVDEKGRFIRQVTLDCEPIEASDIAWEDEKRIDTLMGSALADAGKLIYTSIYRDNAHAGAAVNRILRDRSDKSPKAMRLAGERLLGTANHLSAVATISESFPGYSGYFDTEREFYQRESAQQEMQDSIDEALGASGNLSFSVAVFATAWEAAAPKGASPLEIPEELRTYVDRARDELRTKARAARNTEEQAAAMADALKLLAELEDPDDENEQSQLQNANSKFEDARLGAPDKGKGEINEVDAEQLGDYAERDLQEEDKKNHFISMSPTWNGEPISTASIWEKPNPNVYQQTHRAVHSLIARTRAALSFRNEISRMDEYGLRSGLIDEGNLSALATRSPSVFRRQDVVSAPAVHLGIMVDESGSMWGPGVDTARKTAILLWEACKNLPGVSVSIWGHTANQQYNDSGCQTHRYIERSQGDPNTLGSIAARGNNLDGAAITYAGKRMQELSRPGESRILFLLADGQPAGHAYSAKYDRDVLYGGGSGVRHTRDCIDYVRRTGTQMLGLGMGYGINAEDLEKMFGPRLWRHVKEVNEVPQVLAQLLKQVLRTGRV